ncbi:hypothetical protein [Shewanella japonica]|uniref:hypothetical protein n=1 Tax=Shewanella japonica TaxID=93973 RepID=UPI002494FAB4|nr:hypothetical protein [Shewanella japonica]
MTTKFENIENADIKVNQEGDVELSPELAEAVAGGFNPEEEELEGNNLGCINGSCAADLK